MQADEPDEEEPMLKRPVLVLAPHARLGRQISIIMALLFLFGFHGALVLVAGFAGVDDCDISPLRGFLLTFGVLGLAASAIYFLLEAVVSPEPLLPGLQASSYSLRYRLSLDLNRRFPKLLVLVVLIGAAISGAYGTAVVLQSPACQASAPVMYKWAFAAMLAFCVFSALIILVPLLSVLMPMLAIVLAPLIAALAACAAWMHEAGTRGAWGTANALQRAIGLSVSESEQLVVSPNSRFALYVNTTALCWFFGYLLIEVKLYWDLACDVPLHLFVGVVGTGGLLLTVIDFLRDVFKNPMPPLTKLEQAQAQASRGRRLITCAYILAATLVWGALGLVWLDSSTSCAHTAAPIYRLAVLINICFVALCSLIAVLLLILGLDFCCSGRLRMVIVFDR